MKCTFDESDLRPAWNAMLPPGAADDIAAYEDDDWHLRIIRVEASGNTLTLAGPYGTRSIPAIVEEPGVVFCPIRHFIEHFPKHWTDVPTYHLHVTPDFFQTQVLRAIMIPTEFEVFDDVATAPQTFLPPEYDPDYRDDNDDFDAGEETDGIDADAVTPA